MSSILHSLLVGAFYRPPAKQVLAHLPAGAELILQREPGNPWDAGAIKVLVDVAQAVPETQMASLDEALTGTGIDMEEIMQSPLQVGYIISPTNKKLGSWASNIAVAEFMERGDCRARLGFTPEGEPTVITELMETRSNAD
jgi:hypothetical protein